MAELYRYAAFISYSSKDVAFANRLHRAMEGFNIPTLLGEFDIIGGGEKRYRNRIAPVFKDREELPSGPLGELLEAALRASSALVVVCSQNAAASEWVEKEIRFFESLGRRDRIFAIIAKDTQATSGTDELEATCFPPAMRHAARRLAGDANALDVVCGDARNGKDGFRNAWLKIVAGIIGVNVGVLVDRDRKRRRSRRRRIAAGVMALVLSALGAATWVDTQAWRTRLSTVAENIASQGDPMIAASFALGGEPPIGALIAARSDRADAVLARVGSVRMGLDLGRPGQTEIGGGFLLSDNGAVVVVKNENLTITYYDIVHGTSRTLGDFGIPASFQLSSDGGKLLVGSPDTASRSAALQWRLIDLAHDAATLELGSLDVMNGPQLAKSGTALAMKRLDGTGIYYDLSRNEEAHDLGKVRELLLSENGARLVKVGQDGTATAYDLGQQTLRDLGHFDERVRLVLSKNGAGLLVLDASGSKPMISDTFQDAVATYYNLATGAPGRPLGQLGNNYQLSANGRGLLVTQANGAASYLDLSAAGTVQDLGRLKNSAMSDNGAIVVTQDESGVGTYYNFAQADLPVTLGDLGKLRSFVLSADGTVLATRSLDGKAVAYNLAAGTTRELGDVGEHPASYGMGFVLSANGAALLAESFYDHVTRYFDLVHETPVRELGQLNFSALSTNGEALVTLNMDGNALYYDLTADAPSQLHGAALAADVCRMSGDAIRPFPLLMRDPARSGDRQTTEAQTLFATLRGRPWHPCDWRGLLSGAEGFAQFRRFIEIRYFGAPDYLCEERTASGQRDAVSIARCARLRGASAATTPK